MAHAEENLEFLTLCDSDSCFEVAEAGDGVVLRNKQNPDAGTIRGTREEMDALAIGWVRVHGLGVTAVTGEQAAPTV